MKKLDRKSYEEIRNWMYRNARPLEMAIWQYEFENGSKDSVIKALSFYQNEDGGFGNALEADSWNPASSPYTTLTAINKLKDLNITDKNHSMIQGIFRFIESGEHSTEKGWIFNIPSNNDYPHAPWWTYDKEANEYESIGVSAGIACFLLRFADQDSSLYHKVISIVDTLVEKVKTPGNFGDMGVGGYCELLEAIPVLGLSNRYDIDLLTKTVKKLVYNAIERDSSKWAYYGKTPSSFISSPESIYYKENEEIMQKELDYIIEHRPDNGVWGITWSWFDLNEIYPKEFAVSENWWKADIAIGKLKLLRKFGRVE